ncbi:MAG: HNH endonuclease [Thaumarchaeota archaeon]|nr:HNH endonuclease [Nitrososphaerota archaeon]
MIPTAKDFENELIGIFHEAQKRKEPHIDVDARDLHLQIGGYPNDGNHRMPMCCDAMNRLKRECDKTLKEPTKGKGANLTIRYYLPRYDTM